MGRYQGLAEHLRRLPASVWEASFDEIERILGKPLPQSAYRYPAWWANQSGAGHSQVRGWRSAGWRTAKLDLGARRVRFEREEDSQDGRGSDEDRLFDEAQRWTGIDQRSSLIREALKALIEREASVRLGRLGGTMPDFLPPERARSKT